MCNKLRGRYWKRIEEALQQANDLLRLVVVMRDSNDAIVVQDMYGQIIAWNPRAVRLYGWTEAEALTMSITDLTPEELREEGLTRVRELSRSKTLETYH